MWELRGPSAPPNRALSPQDIFQPASLRHGPLLVCLTAGAGYGSVIYWGAFTPAMRFIVQARREEAAGRPLFGEYIFSLSDLRSKGQPVSYNAVLTEHGKCGGRPGFQLVKTFDTGVAE